MEGSSIQALNVKMFVPEMFDLLKIKMKFVVEHLFHCDFHFHCSSSRSEIDVRRNPIGQSDERIFIRKERKTVKMRSVEDSWRRSVPCLVLDCWDGIFGR